MATAADTPPAGALPAEVVTVEELNQFFAERERFGVRHTRERAIATDHGWDSKEFKRLYVAYLDTTDKKPGKGGITSKQKGDALEAVGHYLLEYSGFAAESVDGLKVRNIFQVDGRAQLNSGATWLVFGAADERKFFPDFFFESKNLDDPMDSTEFAVHGERMRRSGVRCGVCISTGGYAIGNKQGFCDELYYAWRTDDVAHLLLTCDDLRAVADNLHPPLVCFAQAYIRVKTRAYEDANTQAKFTSETCLTVVAGERDRHCRSPACPVAAEAAALV